MSADDTGPAGGLTEAFAASHDIFEGLVGWLEQAEAAELTAAELEERLQEQSREVFRQLFADYLELRARDEPRLSPIVDAQGATHGTVEGGHSRPLTTVAWWSFATPNCRLIAHRGSREKHPPKPGPKRPAAVQAMSRELLSELSGLEAVGAGVLGEGAQHPAVENMARNLLEQQTPTRRRTRAISETACCHCSTWWMIPKSTTASNEAAG